MSAFMVDDTHIDVLISAALQRDRHGYTLSWYHGEMPETVPGEPLYDETPEIREMLSNARREVTSDNAGLWGALLVAENRKSVNHRYSEDEWEEPYQFTRYEGRFDPVKILSALACYEYQSCEHPGWRTSEAKRFCEALTDRMINQLPGYDKGPWEVTDAAQVMIGAPMKVRSL